MNDDRPRSPSELPDEDLVALAVAERGTPRGEAAAAELFGRHADRIHAWCRRMLRDPERALDVAQEAQIQAWRHLERFERRSKFTSWLFVIVRNRCLSALRPVSLVRDPEADLDEVVDPRRGVDEELVERQDEAALRRLIAEVLEPDEQQALALRCFERVPVEEITVILGLDNRSGARALLQKARRKLRAALERRDGIS